MLALSSRCHIRQTSSLFCHILHPFLIFTLVRLLVGSYKHVCSGRCDSRPERRIKHCLGKLLFRSGKVKARVREVCVIRNSHGISQKSVFLDSLHLLIHGAETCTLNSSSWPPSSMLQTPCVAFVAVPRRGPSGTVILPHEGVLRTTDCCDPSPASKLRFLFV